MHYKHAPENTWSFFSGYWSQYHRFTLQTNLLPFCLKAKLQPTLRHACDTITRDHFLLQSSQKSVFKVLWKNQNHTISQWHWILALTRSHCLIYFKQQSVFSNMKLSTVMNSQACRPMKEWQAYRDAIPLATAVSFNKLCSNWFSPQQLLFRTSLEGVWLVYSVDNKCNINKILIVAGFMKHNTVNANIFITVNQHCVKL